VLTDDVVGLLGRPAMSRCGGRDDYTACIAALIAALPDVRLDVAEHAHDGEARLRAVDHARNGDGWVLSKMTGIDRIRLRDGQVAENVIVFDTNAFEHRAGIAVPWRNG